MGCKSKCQREDKFLEDNIGGTCSLSLGETVTWTGHRKRALPVNGKKKQTNWWSELY